MCYVRELGEGLLCPLLCGELTLSLSAVNYRLAPGSKYPSQLFEAFSAWAHLRRLGYSQIFVGGDSAGANLALNLWRYLHDVVGASGTVPGLVLHSVRGRRSVADCSWTDNPFSLGSILRGQRGNHLRARVPIASSPQRLRPQGSRRSRGATFPRLKTRGSVPSTGPKKRSQLCPLSLSPMEEQVRHVT